MKEELDKYLKDKVSGYKPPFKEAYWEDAVSLLDKNKRRRKRMWYWFFGSCLVLAMLYFSFYSTIIEKHADTSGSLMVENSSDQDQLKSLAINENHTETKKKDLSGKDMQIAADDLSTINIDSDSQDQWTTNIEHNHEGNNKQKSRISAIKDVKTESDQGFSPETRAYLYGSNEEAVSTQLVQDVQSGMESDKTSDRRIDLNPSDKSQEQTVRKVDNIDKENPGLQKSTDLQIADINLMKPAEEVVEKVQTGPGNSSIVKESRPANTVWLGERKKGIEATVLQGQYENNNSYRPTTFALGVADRLTVPMSFIYRSDILIHGFNLSSIYTSEPKTHVPHKNWNILIRGHSLVSDADANYWDVEAGMLYAHHLGRKWDVGVGLIAGYAQANFSMVDQIKAEFYGFGTNLYTQALIPKESFYGKGVVQLRLKSGKWSWRANLEPEMLLAMKGKKVTEHLTSLYKISTGTVEFEKIENQKIERANIWLTDDHISNFSLSSSFELDYRLSGRIHIGARMGWYLIDPYRYVDKPEFTDSENAVTSNQFIKAGIYAVYGF